MIIFQNKYIHIITLFIYFMVVTIFLIYFKSCPQIKPKYINIFFNDLISLNEK